MYSETPDVFDDFTGQSATHAIMNRMELFGALPPADEIDHRPMPDLDNGTAALDISTMHSMRFLCSCAGKHLIFCGARLMSSNTSLSALIKGLTSWVLKSAAPCMNVGGSEVKSLGLKQQGACSKSSLMRLNMF